MAGHPRGGEVTNKTRRAANAARAAEKREADRLRYARQNLARRQRKLAEQAAADAAVPVLERVIMTPERIEATVTRVLAFFEEARRVYAVELGPGAVIWVYLGLGSVSNCGLNTTSYEPVHQCRKMLRDADGSLMSKAKFEAKGWRTTFYPVILPRNNASRVEPGVHARVLGRQGVLNTREGGSTSSEVEACRLFMYMGPAAGLLSPTRQCGLDFVPTSVWT